MRIQNKDLYLYSDNNNKKIEIMTEKELKNQIAFQIGFLLYSGLSPKDAIEHLKQIAFDYAEQFKEKPKEI